MSPEFPILQPQNEDPELKAPESSSSAMQLILHLREPFNKNSSQSPWPFPTLPLPQLHLPSAHPLGETPNSRGRDANIVVRPRDGNNMQSPKMIYEEFSITWADEEVVLGVEGRRRNYAITSQ